MLVPPADGAGAERAVITDFGLARSDSAEAFRITTSGEVLGTPVYMSPEQVQGEAVTRATDIYTLGVVLYEMLAGHLPFEDDLPLANALRRLNTAPTPLRHHVPDIPETWEAAVLRCLAIEPADRFQRAGDVVAALC